MNFIKKILIGWNEYLDKKEREGKKPFYKTFKFWLIIGIFLFFKYPDYMLSLLLKIVIFIENIIT